ncbi:DsrE family protein [Vreelandella alkaliphila]|uniref:DsrE family protein n=1 Tax=Halomonadaceae TaxID=28256 RepID=UPI002647571C|nr:DsrE family protein [Halomonas sp. KG2]WKD28812.1 DsrE family protein [Halomonas sp. KG2]
MHKTLVMAGVLALVPMVATADNHDAESDKALMILTSGAVQTQSMAMILGNAMRQQGTDLHILLCDAAGDLAVDGYESESAVNTPPSNPAGQVKPEGMLKMLMGEGVSVDVCAIYLPNTDYTQEDLLEGVGVAAPGPMAEMMRDPAIPVFSF